MRNAISLLILLLAACGGGEDTPSIVDAGLAGESDVPHGPDGGSLGGDTDTTAPIVDTGGPPADATPPVTDTVDVGDAEVGGDAAHADTPPRNADVFVDPAIPTAEEVAKKGPYAVGTRTLELIDTTRETPPNGDFPGAPSRTLVTDVYYPASVEGTDAPLLPGPWPMVVYSHGYMSSRSENTILLEYLASHGMVVAASDFPLSSQGAPGGSTITDVGNQPGDVSFVIDSLVTLAGGDGWAASALANPPQVAAAGLSLGGLTTGLLLFDADSRDDRIGAYVILGGPLCFIPPAWIAKPLPPTLLVYGDGDAIIPYEAHGHVPFLAMPGPRALVTLAGGTHVGFASLAAALFENFPDPDSIGCSALADNLQGQSFSDLASRSGFAGERPDIDSCPAPCSDPPQGPKMTTTAQAALLPLTVGAFLRGHFASDPTLIRFVQERLPAERQDVTVEGDLLP